MVTSIPFSDWPRRLREFTARNACRHTVWERQERLTDREVGEGPHSDGPFLGASYDTWGRSIRIMFADESGVPYYRATAIDNATSLEIETDAAGRETGLRITWPAGALALRFVPKRFETPRWSERPVEAARHEIAE